MVWKNSKVLRIVSIFVYINPTNDRVHPYLDFPVPSFIIHALDDVYAYFERALAQYIQNEGGHNHESMISEWYTKNNLITNWYYK